jgi:hypothetical protein
MIRVELELSVPSAAGKPVGVLDLTALVSESVNAGLGDTGAVVHRITVEEADA